jgi:hypothetical protein
MDFKGNIHLLPESGEELAQLEERVGKLVPIPEAELRMLRQATIPQRRDWYRKRCNKRKGQRLARRANR